MKKFLVLLLSLLTVLTLAGCKKEEKEEEVVVDYNAKAEGVMTYQEYMDAELGAEVCIEAYVQAAQSYWGGATMYLADLDGAYFVYQDSSLDPDISEEDYAKLGLTTETSEGWTGLANGQKVLVKGIKSEWAGEVEITGSALVPCTVTIEEGNWLADAKQISMDKAENNKNALVTITNLTIAASTNSEGEEVAYLYKWDGSGSEGTNSDLYFNVTDNDGNAYTFTVESYLMYEGSDVYNAVKALAIGDVVDITGFMYYYNAPQLHVTNVVAAGK